MNHDLTRYFHLNGMATGMFISVFIFALLCTFVFLLRRRKTLFFRLIILSLLSFASFALFDIYYQLAYLPLDGMYPAWFFWLAKISLPIGLIIFINLFVQITVLSSEKTYLTFRKMAVGYNFLMVLYSAALVSFIFITDSQYVISISMVLLGLTAVIGGAFCWLGLQPRPLAWLLSSVTLVSGIVFFVIAYAVLCVNSYPWAGLFIVGNVLIGLMMLCLGLAILFYGYHEVYTFSDAEPYDWRRLLSSIHTAIDQNEFYLVFQPKINTQEQSVVGVEALLRWGNAKHGIVAPDSFISLAEKSYLINTICRWVIEEAVKQASQLSQSGIYLIMSINFSVKNLHPEMVAYLSGILKKYDVPPQQIMVEVTETVFIQQTLAETRALAMLSNMGVRVSLDDYGMGFSSLSTINKMALDELKIDKSFVMDMSTNDEHRIIVESILYMTQRLGINAVAEGVEDTDTAHRLLAIGCHTVQGFAFAKPMTSELLKEWLEDSKYAVPKDSSGVISIQRQAV